MHVYGPEAITSMLDGHFDLLDSGGAVRPTRLASQWRSRVPTQSMLMMVDASAGVCLRFRTDATTVTVMGDFFTLSIDGEERWGKPHLSIAVNDEITHILIDTASRADLDSRTDELSWTRGPTSTSGVSLPPGSDKSVVVWLPHNAVSDVHSISANAELHPEPDDRPTWLHHGSSISHCLEAAVPAETWPALASWSLDVRLSNLAFAGNALLDPFVARQIREAPAQLISVKIGINLVNADVMRPRAFRPALEGFLDTVREGHPETSLLLISPITCPLHERHSGPTKVDENGICYRDPDDSGSLERLTLEGIRAEMQSVVARRSSDRFLYYLPGPDLFDQAHVDQGLLPDGLHPSPAGYRALAANFAHHVRSQSELLGSVRPRSTGAAHIARRQ